MILRRFAELAMDTRRDGLTDEVRFAATRAVVDWFSATIAGADMAAARILRQALLGEGATGTAGLLPDGRTTDVRTAALVNATASHTAELDDIFRNGLYHPGSPTVAAALAIGEHTHTGGDDLLRGVAIGYEVGARIAAAIQPAHYTYWHTTGTVGTIGAAAAAGELLGLDEDQFVHALATATTTAAGLQQAFRSDAMSKPLHAGHAAEAGVLAAMTAAHGFTGALDVLEGESGFGAAMANDPDWTAAISQLGEQWRVGQATVKNHSCCGHTFAAVDAALALRAAGISVDDIREIRVATYGTATKVAGDPDPRTAFEAKFSTAYCVAAALLMGSVRLRAFEPRQLCDPALRALMNKVTLSVDPDFDAAFPGQRAARVTVVDRDGDEHVHVRHTRKGDPDDPLTDEELRDKFADLVVPVTGAEAAQEIGKRLWRLPHIEDVAGLSTVGAPQ